MMKLARLFLYVGLATAVRTTASEHFTDTEANQTERSVPMARFVAATLLMICVVASFGCGNANHASPVSQSGQTTGTSPGTAGTALAITSISPASAVAGSPDLTLTITGSGFEPTPGTFAIFSVSGSQVLLDTTFVSTTQVTAVVPAALLQLPLTAAVFVEVGDWMGFIDGVSYPRSNQAIFTLAASGRTDFSPAGAMTTARSFHTESLLPDGRVLIAGGAVATSDPDCESALRTAEIYEPNTRTFSRTGDLGERRYGHAATVLGNGRVLITGGGLDCSPGVSSTELFDPLSGSFLEGSPMHARRTFHTATLLADGRVLVAGGWPLGGGPTAELYDPSTGQFGPAERMTAARAEHAAVRLQNGKVLITGGYNSSATLNSAELYDPAADTFQATGNMSSARILHSATMLRDGKVLITGGTTGNGIPVDTAEIYDPATGQFSPTDKMQSARLDHRATLLADGRVLISGGSGPYGPLASAEFFDPTTGQFTGHLLMSDRRDAHTLTMLNTGEVLIVGGGVASADIYK